MKSTIALLTIGMVATSYAGNTKGPVQFDATRLRTGTFVYRDVRGEQEIGRSEITLKKLPGADRFSFTNRVTGEFNQQWTAIATTTLHPISASLSFRAGPPVFDLKYAADRVTGFVVKHQGQKAESRRSIDDNVPAEVIDQRIDWAAVSASTLEPGREFEFEVYDPNLGVSHVVVRTGAVQSVTVPAGPFKVVRATYEISKRSGTERYRVFITADPPRMLVREEFPDGTASDLISMDKG